eukprot:1953313-Rhodomonas_salina.1
MILARYPASIPTAVMQQQPSIHGLSAAVYSSSTPIYSCNAALHSVVSPIYTSTAPVYGRSADIFGVRDGGGVCGRPSFRHAGPYYPQDCASRSTCRSSSDVGPMLVPGGKEILMTDTVGFIQKLPTKLVSSFKSTLEVLSAYAPATPTPCPVLTSWASLYQYRAYRGTNIGYAGTYTPNSTPRNRIPGTKCTENA